LVYQCVHQGLVGVFDGGTQSASRLSHHPKGPS